VTRGIPVWSFVKVHYPKG